jgi:L-asparaginase
MFHNFKACPKTWRGAVIAGAAAVIIALPTVAASAQTLSASGLPIENIGPPHNPNKPNIVVVDAGGTLEATARDRISYLHYSGGIKGGVATILKDLYPELAAVANVSVVQAGGVLGGSSAVGNAALYKVSRAVDAELARSDVDGVVVTAGTSVLEEDAYFLDLTVQSDKPVVMTGAMHQYGTFTYDAYTNLFSSIRLAASGKTTCFGTVVLLNDQFFAARDVSKTDGFRMDTFKDRIYGPLGIVNEDNIVSRRAPGRVAKCGTAAWKTPFDLSKTTPDKFAQVEIVYGHVEGDAVAITAPVAAGFKGIVTAGFGPGDISRPLIKARDEAIKKGVLFVATTRTGGEGTYDAGTPGIIGGEDLLPQKARLLLQMGLTFSSDQQQIRQWFSTIGDPGFNIGSERKGK